MCWSGSRLNETFFFYLDRSLDHGRSSIENSFQSTNDNVDKIKLVYIIVTRYPYLHQGTEFQTYIKAQHFKLYKFESSKQVFLTGWSYLHKADIQREIYIGTNISLTYF
jgi:hypothetical protein